uniref:tRNA threonylcarbamoyladenosine biosynthesis protein TsaE n=1 Tax=Candidatus Kentrum sp. UNK TaxID=2126344 RepID=A0A451AIZ7_9GAMM|nr:MAG: tRNA threonylcarbamoyladenosine biosynthesis protein TsaE [Candidatus Kentron sp. UNK]VFK69076.1 MAG: tRNA threonylcarbamoyladenosine biosynthesis protein TsaE [Candidatus Kentron sp. UNK]
MAVQCRAYEVESPTPETTLEFGRLLGSLLRSGDVVGLVGELGAGKTWFTKGIALGLNVPRYEYINSPAYDIIHEYAGKYQVFHMDFYRMELIGAEEYLWLEEYFEREGVCIAEWAEKFLSNLSETFLTVKIDWNPKTDVRSIRFIGEGDRYATIVADMEKR